MPYQQRIVNTDNILQYASNYQAQYLWRPISEYGQVSPHHCWFGQNYTYEYGSAYNSICIPIPSFSFDGNGTNLTIAPSGRYNPESLTFRWALCTSNTYKAKYQSNSGVSRWDDPTQLGSGTFAISANADIRISVNVSFPPNRALYLYIWTYQQSPAGIAPHFSGDVYLYATYETPLPPQPQGIAHIDNGSSYASYTVWIDSGSGWVQCEPYLDTGSGWVLLT